MKDEEFNIICERLKKIQEIINDPYKSPECQYSIIHEIINGEFD